MTNAHYQAERQTSLHASEDYKKKSQNLERLRCPFRHDLSRLACKRALNCLAKSPSGTVATIKMFSVWDDLFLHSNSRLNTFTRDWSAYALHCRRKKINRWTFMAAFLSLSILFSDDVFLLSSVFTELLMHAHQQRKQRARQRRKT